MTFIVINQKVKGHKFLPFIINHIYTHESCSHTNTRLWTLENLVPEHKLKQRLQIIFGTTDALREVIDKAIECDDELRRKSACVS